jgi:hypothetical protein
LRRLHSRSSFAIASVPRGLSVVAGPVTESATVAMRVGSPGTTVSVTSVGVLRRSIATSIRAEKNPSLAAIRRASSTASRASWSSSSSVVSA